AALDLDDLVGAVSNGTGAANASMVSLDSIYYSDVQKKRIATDLEKAKKELAESGYKGEVIKIIANKRGNVPSYPVAVVAQ
ncbi:ABC transporter substrate-binding protein, partial [Escherichia coli]|nr:ABC transporter substrate-binding protein [Escherichia coli]